MIPTPLCRCFTTQKLFCPVNGEQGDYLDKDGAPDCMHPAQQPTQTLLPPDAAPLASQFAQPLALATPQQQADAKSSAAAR